jgi:hypothetical protein
MFHNVVIGKPLVDVSTLFANNKQDWEENEKKDTIFTETRFLPALMKEAGMVSSTSEVRRNKPELCVTLDTVDCVNLKWGKKHLYIVVGE